MKQDKELNEPYEVQITKNNTPSVQPSTSEFQATETNKDEISGEKIEALRSARRRRMKKESLAQEKNSEPSKTDENLNQNPIEMPRKSKPNKRARKNARLRQESANDNKNITALDTSEQNQVANIVENVPVKEDNNEKNNAIALLVNIPICDMPAQIRLKKEKEKEKDPHFRKPDYVNCDYYAYDYETVEECAEELGPDESIEVTIYCAECIPMFAQYIPIRHYFENTRVVRLVNRCLLDTVNPPLPLPVELFPEVLTDQEKSDENNTDDIGIVIKKEPEEPKMEVFSDNENVAEYGENSENINIKREIEGNNINERNLEYEFSNTDLFKNISQRVFQIERDLKTLQKNMNEIKESVEQIKNLSTFSRLLKRENINRRNNRSIQSQTDTFRPNGNEENQRVQLRRNQETVNEQNTVMEMNRECFKNENLSATLSDEKNKIKPFAACSSKSRGKKIRKTSENASPTSIPNMESMNSANDSKIINNNPEQPKPIEKQNEREFKNKTPLDINNIDKNELQGTSSKNPEFKLNVEGNTLVASNKNDAEINACVNVILKQLKAKANNREVVITEQPRPIQQIRRLKTIQEIDSIVENNKFSNDSEKNIHCDVIAEHKENIEKKLNVHEFCTCPIITLNPATPQLCAKGHRLCFSKNKNITNEEVALAAAEWSYLLKLGYRQDETFYRELIAKNTIEDAVKFLKHVQNEFIANGVTVSSIPALRIESDREFEDDESDPAIRRADIICRRNNKRE